MNVAIVVPVYHANELHYDFTRQTIESVNLSDNIQGKIFIINNFSLPQFEPNLDSFQSRYPQMIIKNPKGNQVGASWNLGIKMALEEGFDYVIVCNNDIIFHKNAIGNLVDFAEKHKEFILWTMAEWTDLRTIKTVDDNVFDDNFDEHPHFSCFMVNKKTMDTVGWFDENLHMAYMEDGEFHYRILLSGNKAVKVSKARFYHYGSRTISVDDDIFAINRRTYEENREYIKKKWNTDFHQKAHHPPEEILKEKDIYKFPFNDKLKGWKDW